MRERQSVHNDRLLTLLHMRENKDLNGVMNILYDVITSEEREAFFCNGIDQKVGEAVDEMISYFQKREDYEKCARLKKLKEL